MSDGWKCDKCGHYFDFETGKPYEVRSYEGNTRSGACAHKNYDLCDECKARFDKWIETRPYLGTECSFLVLDEAAYLSQDSHDSVDHPKHYDNGKTECIDWIEERLSPEEFKGYLLGNALKYAYRYEDKGKPVEDLRKAQWYLKKLEELA